MTFDVSLLGYKELNQQLRAVNDPEIELTGCIGQRFIAAGTGGKRIGIHGISGNALGAYLNGSVIETFGNAQDAVGDTMNEGEIIVHGSIGGVDHAAVSLSGCCPGKHLPYIGGRTGSFLGEYQAGGIIIVLGLHDDGKPIVSNYPNTGMHGGKVFLRSDCKGIHFPHQVHAKPAEADDLEEIRPHIEAYCAHFGGSAEELLRSDFTLVTPDSGNPYRQMYVAN